MDGEIGEAYMEYIFCHVIFPGRLPSELDREDVVRLETIYQVHQAVMQDQVDKSRRAKDLK